MRTKNFFKGLAVAAVALVGVFATSCSEEELNLNGTINGSPVDPYTPTELPDGVAYAAISVVDLGDLGLGSKVLYTETKDVTALNGTEIECPDFDGMEEYVIPAAQTISVPTLSKGQTVTIPLTFYVVKTTSAYANVKWNINDAKDWGYNEEGNPYVYGEPEVIKGSENEKLQNLSNYWKDIQVKYSVPVAYFVSVLGETEEAPEGGEGEGEGTEGEEGEGTEGEEGEGTEGEEGEEGEGTEGEEGEDTEGEGEATEALYAIDYSTVTEYNMFSQLAEGCTVTLEDGNLVIDNANEGTNAWDSQLFIADGFTMAKDVNYILKITMSASAEGSVQLGIGNWDEGNTQYTQFAFGTEEKTYEVAIASQVEGEGAHILWQGAKYIGTVKISKVEIIEAPAAKAAATTADEIVAAYVKNMVMPEYGVEAGSWPMTTPTVTLYSGGCVDFTKTIYSTHPTYVFTYMGEEVEVTFEQIMGAFGVLGTPYAIPGHETTFEHSHSHGGYDHGHGHGNNSNAGGGIVTFE